jgi:hypothetical protein
MALRIVFFPRVGRRVATAASGILKAAAGAGLLSQRKVPADFYCLIVPPHRAV